MELLQVEALCWCGERATHTARTVGGEMVTEGEQLAVGDIENKDNGLPAAEMAYEVLCRRHHRRRLTAARARATLSPEVLPFGGAV
jgi:thymidine kinase